ncbi:hypothetical protein C8F01DRAFT_1098314 [Mycena amicta]|nr:hypothetical protein C8F01DRAFT_1098314 [Mycena amicta]
MSSNAALSAAAFPPEIIGEIFLASIPRFDDISPPEAESETEFQPFKDEEELDEDDSHAESDSAPTKNPRPRAQFDYQLTHVCRHWRSTALAFPKLWSFLDIFQTSYNEGESDASPGPSFLLVKAYLARSGIHPLTFRLTYEENWKPTYQPFLDELSKDEYLRRWETASIDAQWDITIFQMSEAESTVAEGDPRKGGMHMPLLRTLIVRNVYFQSEFNFYSVHYGDEPLTILYPFPLARLTRYEENGCQWRDEDSQRQWDILRELTSVVRLRTKLGDPGEFDGADPEGEESFNRIALPQLRIASFNFSSGDVTMRDLCHWLEFPRLQGLNVNLYFSATHEQDVFQDASLDEPFPTQLKGLTALRLCGGLRIDDEPLKRILEELPGLAYLGVEIGGYKSTVNLQFLVELLRDDTILPALRHLALARVDTDDNTLVEALEATLRSRFTRTPGLDTFELIPNQQEKGDEEKEAEVPLLLRSLAALKEETGWDIRVRELENAFWNEEMFL